MKVFHRTQVTLDLINYGREIYFSNDYGEAKNMIPLIESLSAQFEQNSLYQHSENIEYRDAKELLYINDFYYWYSIPIYNKYLSENVIEKLGIDRKTNLFNQSCNTYLYETDKIFWGNEVDFANYENPTSERYRHMLGMLD